MTRDRLLRSALGICLMLSSLAAAPRPDYRLLASNLTNIWYLDAASVRRTGDAALFRVLYVHHPYARMGARRPLYQLLEQEMRCTDPGGERTPRMTVVDTEGKAIFTTAGDPPFFPVVGEMGSAAFDYVCSGKPISGLPRPARQGALDIARAALAELSARNPR